ncbi:MAG: zinc-binding dehydrogenase [Candidatus Eremiobacteraeota bacterium]|nr:zinc-binding dehydrogenase [Candidatus Eremiobacteraeota bacterium]MBC5827641.1 zinc-binding dehydrogenase [Candidatus Eremiobacteraeota bacterium]
MRAAYATKMGGDAPLNNLEIGERPEPTAGPGEARIRVRAATLNHHDYWTLRGVVGSPITLPRILGCDAAGVVDSYGPDAPAGVPPPGSDVIVYQMKFCGECGACADGDPMLCRRFEMLSDVGMEGSFAEYVVVPAVHVLPKPARLSYEEAACLGTTFLTAYRMLFVKAQLRPGQTVLVQGAAGGLSTAAITLAAAAGVFTIASSRSSDRLEVAKRLGAHATVPGGRDAAKAILGLTSGEGVDAVMESVGEPTWATSMRAVRAGGAIVVAGATGGPNPPADLARIFWRQIRIIGSTMGSLSEFIALLRFVECAAIKPLIDRIYPLEHARSAIERLAADEQVGKLVLSI